MHFLDDVESPILITGHVNADPDAVAAAIGLHEILCCTKQDVHVDLYFPEGVNSNAARLLEKLGIHPVEELGEYRWVIAVDTGSLSQIQELIPHIEGWAAKVGFIDHHQHDEEMEKVSSFYVSQPLATSASEIIYDVFKQKGLTPSSKTAQALVAGIAYDTGHLNLADRSTILKVSELLSPGKTLQQALDLINLPTSYPERIARLKAGQRAEITKIGNRVIVFSQLGSYQASAARALVLLGADLAVVAGERDNNVRASLRSTAEFYEETGLHLGDFVRDLLSAADGSGGGHPTAAGVNVAGSIEEFYAAVRKSLSQSLDKPT